MPVINGRFHMNPSYGRALERPRDAEAARNHHRRSSIGRLTSPGDTDDPLGIPVDSSNGVLYLQSSANTSGSQKVGQNGHWVTVDDRHVFLHEPQSAGPRCDTARKRVAKIAEKYDGRTEWAFDKRKDNFGPGTNKCNKFVYDVTKEAGAPATVIGSDGKPRPPLASEWADPHTDIVGWRVLGPNKTPHPGDVAAYKLPGGGASFSGHSGIVTSVDPDGTVHAIAAHDDVVGPDSKFQQTGKGVVFRRYTGGD